MGFTPIKKYTLFLKPAFIGAVYPDPGFSRPAGTDDFAFQYLHHGAPAKIPQGNRFRGRVVLHMGIGTVYHPITDDGTG